MYNMCVCVNDMCKTDYFYCWLIDLINLLKNIGPKHKNLEDECICICKNKACNK